MSQPTQGLVHREQPIFAYNSPGRSGASLPRLDVEPVDPASVWPKQLQRQQAPELPEVTEPQVVRHYTRLSQWNFNIDSGMYPLGSCTMKHNPKCADVAVGMPGFANLHPYQPEAQLQGALALLTKLEQMLATVGGFSRVSLQPAAGAQGELCGLMMMRAYLADHGGKNRNKVLVPDSAHGTNPATCTLSGLQAVPLATGDDGALAPETVRAALSDEVAGIMITNPNTAGLFEAGIAEIAGMVRDAGGLVYMDGANLNAIMGKFRPGDHGIDAMHFNLHKTFGTPHGGGGPGAGPVGVSERLVPYLPTPTVERDGDSYRLDYDRPKSIGRLRSFWGNFGVLLRAYVYLSEYGSELPRVTESAVLNANYLRAKLSEFLHVPYPDRCMHEVIATDKTMKPHGVTTMDIAKRLMDHGFHPPTVYFPLVIPGALMIEPTETEPLAELDAFVEAMRSIAAEAESDAERVKSAPHLTGIDRLDEALAARKPKLRY